MCMETENLIVPKNIPLTLACGNYESVRALIDGAVAPDGIGRISHFVCAHDNPLFEGDAVTITWSPSKGTRSNPDYRVIFQEFIDYLQSLP